MDKALTFSDRWNALCFEPESDWKLAVFIVLAVAGWFAAVYTISRRP